MDPALLIAAASVVVGALIALIFFKNYFTKRRSEVQSIAEAELQPEHNNKKPAKSTAKKQHTKPHSHASDKVYAFRIW